MQGIGCVLHTFEFLGLSKKSFLLKLLGKVIHIAVANDLEVYKFYLSAIATLGNSIILDHFLRF